ncbi:MAG: queuosine precursor transporter [Nanoarchaeota archaeon]
MNDLILIILWIILISAVTIIGSLYVRRYQRPDAIIGFYIAFITFSNIAAVKIASFDLGFATFYAPAAVLIFSVTFLMTDIVNEKFGRKETHKMIFIAFIAQVAVAFFSWLVLSFSSAPFWTNQNALSLIIGQVPRIIFASWIAFLISENLDAYIFSIFKKVTKGKHLWARNALSSIPSMAIDSILFVTIAFAGVQPILPLIIGLTLVKWLVGIIDIPFMYLNRWVMYHDQKN